MIFVFRFGCGVECLNHFFVIGADEIVLVRQQEIVSGGEVCNFAPRVTVSEFFFCHIEWVFKVVGLIMICRRL